MKTMIDRILGGWGKFLACLLAICATSGAWAANGNGTLNYELTASANSGLYNVVIDNRIDKRITSSASFGATTFTLASPALEIPATDALPAGTKIKVSQIEFCRNISGDASYEAIRVKINGVTSDQRVVGGGYSSSIGVGVNGNSGTGTGVKITYAFSSTLEVAVGTSYAVEFLNDSNAALSSVKYCYVTGTGDGSVAAQSLLNLDGSNKVLFKVTGTVDYTFNAVGGSLSLNDDANWASGKAPATTTGNVKINATADTTLSGSLTADSIYVTGTGVADLSGATVRGTFKGDGTVKYANNVRPTTTGTDVVFTNSAWTGTVWLYDYAYTTSLSGSNLALYPHYWSNSGSKLKFTKVKGYLPGRGNSSVNYAWQLGYEGQVVGELVLEDEGGAAAFNRVDGFSHSAGLGNSYCRFAKLSGSGTLADSKDQTVYMVFDDAEDFEGTINVSKGTSVIFGAESPTDAAWDGKIVIASGSEATVAAGKTWTSKNGVIVNGTLTLADSSSTLASAVTGSGTIVGGGTENVPNIASLTQSGWTGTVEVSGAASMQGMTGSSSTQFMNSGSTFKVTAGHLGLTAVTSLPGKVSVASGATLYLASASLTDLTLNYGTVEGQINLAMSSNLESLTLNLGTVRSVPGGLVASLSSATIALKEIPSEGGTITFDASGLPGAITSVDYTLTYADGTALTPISTTTEGSVTTIKYTPHISGVATDIDWDFTDGTDDALEQAPAGVSKNSDSSLTFYVDSEDSSNTGVYLKHHPYVDGAASFIHNNSSAITVAAVGTMPSGSKTIFMNFGSAYNNKYGLLLANSTNANEVLVAYNYGATVTPITYMTVPNAATARHSYIITKEDGESSTTFTVYLDGIKWKTVTTNFKIEFSSSNTGIQFGSDFGGNIRDAGYPAVSDNTGILNVLRVYGRVITPAEIAAYASTFPYVSPNGSASRTFATAVENWIDTAEASEVWDNSGEADSGTPTAGASLTVAATVDTTITVNLAAETQYEALTINGSSVKFLPSSGMIKVAGMTVVGTTVTNVYGAVDMSGGPMTLTEDGDITFDYSAYDASAIYTTTDIPLTSDVDEDSTKVHLIAAVTPYRTCSLVYTSGHYAMRVTPDHEAGSEVYFASGYLTGVMGGGSDVGTVYLETEHTHQTILFPGDTMVIDGNSSLWENQVWVSDTFIGNIKITRTTPMTLHNGELTNPILVGKTITVEDGASLTISKHNSYALTLGALTINGAGDVALSGPLTLGGAVVGTATVTMNDSVSVASSGSIANTISGSGTITYAALPSAVPAGFTSWTGTVVLPAITSGASGLNLNAYGTAGSTVSVAGVSSGAWLADAVVAPTVEITGDVTLSEFSATFANTFNKLSGSRAFSLTADGTTQGYANGYFLIKDVSDFTGSITVAAPGLALGGTSKPSSSEWYGKIVVQEPVTVGSGATWSASGVVLSATTAALTVPDGATVPAVASGVAGYKVDADTTTTPGSTVYSLVAKGATVSGVAFNYGKDYATADVTATVSGDATTYTLTVDGANYEGEVSGSTVTFTNVATGHASAYDNVSYAISATDGTSSVVVSGGSGSELVATTTGWINENASTHVGGSWTNSAAVIYTDGAATITDNRFAADSASTTSRVKMEFEVCFMATSDENVSGEAQGAIKLGEVNSETTFMVLAPGGSWTAVSNVGLTPDPTATNKVVMTFDYALNKYGVSIDGNVLTNSLGEAFFPLAKNNATGVQDIDFAGTGTLVSMKGDQLEGYMVKDNAGGWYATIEAAIQAYNSANGPYTVLHNGTAPSGWDIVEGVLIKVAKGLFFMAY